MHRTISLHWGATGCSFQGFMFRGCYRLYVIATAIGFAKFVRSSCNRLQYTTSRALRFRSMGLLGPQRGLASSMLPVQVLALAEKHRRYHLVGPVLQRPRICGTAAGFFLFLLDHGVDVLGVGLGDNETHQLISPNGSLILQQNVDTYKRKNNSQNRLYPHLQLHSYQPSSGTSRDVSRGQIPVRKTAVERSDVRFRWVSCEALCPKADYCTEPRF